jgi:hypothetical protein
VAIARVDEFPAEEVAAIGHESSDAEIEHLRRGIQPGENDMIVGTGQLDAVQGRDDVTLATEHRDDRRPLPRVLQIAVRLDAKRAVAAGSRRRPGIAIDRSTSRASGQ